MPETILDDLPNSFSAPGGRQDTILGLGGNDTLAGNDRDDSILGGEGDDRLDGGSQTDTVRGEAGADTIVNLQAGNDLLDGGDGDDSIVGGGEAETILGGAGDDILVGNSGDNSIDGGSGADSIVGGSNNEVLRGGEDADTIVSGGGIDLLAGGSGDDSLLGGGFGQETLDGGSGNDALVANGDTAIMLGGAGDDTFSGLSGNYADKYVNGGSGVSRAILNETYDPSRLTFATGNFQNDPNLAYQAYYTTSTNYRVYFGEFDGTLDFNDIDVGLTVVCFAAGTMVLTAAGERPVETLRAGDLVVTASGIGAPIKPVRWVGHRRVDLDTHPRPGQVAPVRILPGALGEGVPHRVLRVSPEHGVLVDESLVPAELLVDGIGILREPAQGSVVYHHVELDAHDLLIADGAPSESYLDLGNRHAFANGGLVAMLAADFRPAPGADRAGRSCRPLVTEGAALAAARRRIAQRRRIDTARAAPPGAQPLGASAAGATRLRR